MRKMNMMVLALMGLTAGLSANQANPEVAVADEVAAIGKKTDKVAAKLSNDEVTFASKLSERNKKAFSEKLNADQRKVAMKMSGGPSGAGAQRSAEKKTLTPNEAVQKILKDNNISMDEVQENSIQPVSTATAQ